MDLEVCKQAEKTLLDYSTEYEVLRDIAIKGDVPASEIPFPHGHTPSSFVNELVRLAWGRAVLDKILAQCAK